MIITGFFFLLLLGCFVIFFLKKNIREICYKDIVSEKAYLMPISPEEFANNDYGDVVMSRRDLLKEIPQLNK